MASIQKIEGKKGTSYKITVTHGRNSHGKQIRHYKTWIPEPKMTPKQVEKKLNQIAVEFEQQIQYGFAADNRQTFSEYAVYALDIKSRTGKSIRTIERYEELLERINPFIGHIKLNEIRPAHLNNLYAALGKEGVRKGSEKAAAKVDISALLKQKNITRNELSRLTGVSTTSISAVTKGNRVQKNVADAISSGLGKNTTDLFDVFANRTPLSNKTVLEHHRLVSSILALAEKEMLVPYNAATKTTPPTIEEKEIEPFQPDEVAAIQNALEKEPLKWKLATHLLLITGCRRGEIIGLKWQKINWDAKEILINETLLLSRKLGVYEGKTKTKTTRIIKVPDETIQLLKQYRESYLDLRLKNGDRWQDSDYIFVQDNGIRMHPDSLTDWLSKFSKRHNLPHINPHKFRHTMISLLYASGIDPVTISKRAGHAQVSTTSNVYAHLIKQADEDASESLADIVLRGAGGNG